MSFLQRIVFSTVQHSVRWLAASVLVLGVAAALTLSCSRTLGGGDFEAEARAACEGSCNHKIECDPDDPWKGQPVIFESVDECVESCLGWPFIQTDNKCGWAVIENRRCLAEVPCEEYLPWVRHPSDAPAGDPCPGWRAACLD